MYGNGIFTNSQDTESLQQKRKDSGYICNVLCLTTSVKSDIHTTGKLDGGFFSFFFWWFILFVENPVCLANTFVQCIIGTQKII